MKTPLAPDKPVTRQRETTSSRARLAVTSITILGTLWLGVTPARAQLFVNFTTIADASTAIPEGAGSFVASPVDPCIWFRNVALGGEGSGGQQGVYLFRAAPIPPPIKVADLNTAVPDGTGNFTALDVGPAIWESSVAFFGAGSGGQQGIYLFTDVATPLPPPIRIADLATPVPGGTGNFIGFPAGPSIGSDAGAFIGDGSDGQQGVYIFVPPNPVMPVADTNMEIPDGFGNFTGFVPPNPVQPIPPPISENIVAFFGAGSDGQEGIYLVDIAMPQPPPIVPVADRNTAIPVEEGAGNFFFFERVALENSDVAFVGGGAVTVGSGDQQFLYIEKGVYTVIGGTLARVADRSTLVPGGTGWFSDFGAVAIDPGKVVFVGFGTDDEKGLYTDFGGSLAQVIAVGDTLGGKMVADVGFGPFGFSDGEVVFRATFDDGSQAVMVATFCTGIQFAGFHPPIGGADATGGAVNDPVRSFKLKSTIPIKMTLTNCEGAPVTEGTHTVQLIKWTSAVDSDPPIDASPADAATTGNQFRLTDAETGEWHFNLDTEANVMSKGTWQIVVTLADGSTHTAFVSLK